MVGRMHSNDWQKGKKCCRRMEEGGDEKGYEHFNFLCN